MRIESLAEGFASLVMAQFQRWYSENEDWKGSSGTVCINQRRFQRWYSENEDWKAALTTQRSTSEKFQRWYSENEDWKPRLLQKHFSKQRFKGDTQKMRIEREPTIFDWCRKYSVSKVILRKWGLKGIKCLVRILWPGFQRWYSENEDWKLACGAHIPQRIHGFKGDTQKMRIERLLMRTWELRASLVSKVILRKWGLKGQFFLDGLYPSLWFQRWYSENEDWKVKGNATKNQLE